MVRRGLYEQKPLRKDRKMKINFKYLNRALILSIKPVDRLKFEIPYLRNLMTQNVKMPYSYNVIAQRFLDADLAFGFHAVQKQMHCDLDSYED